MPQAPLRPQKPCSSVSALPQAPFHPRWPSWRLLRLLLALVAAVLAPGCSPGAPQRRPEPPSDLHACWIFAAFLEGFQFKFPIALTFVILFESWRYFPLAMLFILARIQSVPSELFEAAEIDGATPTQKFRNITWPLILGVLFILFLIFQIGPHLGFYGRYHPCPYSPAGLQHPGPGRLQNAIF